MKVEILGEAREAREARAVHIRVVLGFYCASLDRIWIIEIVGKGLERSTSEGIENKWGTPLRVVTPGCLERRGLDIGEALLYQHSRLPHRGQVDVDEEHIRILLCEQERRLEADATMHGKVEESGGSARAEIETARRFTIRHR